VISWVPMAKSNQLTNATSSKSKSNPRTCSTSKYEVTDSHIITVLYCHGRKLEDFRREGETNVSQNILQTRYNFFHDKRFYKLGQIFERLQIEKELRMA